MDGALEELVRERAGNVCEYCGLPQRFSRLAFPVDHIIALQHHGPTVEANLARACPFCNSHKGPNIAGIDPQTGQLTRLFGPRRDEWDQHFRTNGVIVIGLTDVGRTTIAVVAINHPVQIATRRTLLDEGSS